MPTVKAPMESLRAMDARRGLGEDPASEEEAILASPPRVVSGPSQKQLIARGCVGIAGLGLVAALVCAAVVRGASSPSPPSPPAKSVFLSPKTEESCDYTTQTSCPAEGLLRSPAIVEGAAKSIEDVALLPLDQSDIIRRTVRVAFVNISAQLQEHAPEIAEGFKHLRIKKIEQEGVVASLGLLSDSEIQSMGRYVARQIKHRNDPSEDPADLKRYIQEILQLRLHEMQALRNRIVPTSVRALWGEGHPELVPRLQLTQLQMTLDRYNMRGLKAPSRGGAVPPAAAEEEGGTASGDFALFAGAMQEGRVVLDLLQMHLQRSLLGADPSLDAELHGTLNFGSRVWDLPCEVEEPSESEETEEAEALEQVYCKLKFGAMGLDALRSTLIDDMASFA